MVDQSMFRCEKVNAMFSVGSLAQPTEQVIIISGVSVEAESAVAGSLCRLASAVDGRIVGDDIDRAWSFALCSLRLAALRTTLSFCLA